MGLDLAAFEKKAVRPSFSSRPGIVQMNAGRMGMSGLRQHQVKTLQGSSSLGQGLRHLGSQPGQTQIFRTAQKGGGHHAASSPSLKTRFRLEMASQRADLSTKIDQIGGLGQDPSRISPVVAGIDLRLRKNRGLNLQQQEKMSP